MSKEANSTDGNENTEAPAPALMEQAAVETSTSTEETRPIEAADLTDLQDFLLDDEEEVAGGEPSTSQSTEPTTEEPETDAVEETQADLTEEEGSEKKELTELDKVKHATQQRIDELTAEVAEETSRADTLADELEAVESELTDARAKLQNSSELTDIFTREEDIDSMEKSLAEGIPDLEAAILGELETTEDEFGNKVTNTVQIGDKKYPVAQVKARILELKRKQASLPAAREGLRKRQAEAEQAKKLYPKAYKRGSKESIARTKLLRETPALVGLGEMTVVQILIGRQVLENRKGGRTAAQKVVAGAAAPEPKLTSQQRGGASGSSAAAAESKKAATQHAQWEDSEKTSKDLEAFLDDD